MSERKRGDPSDTNIRLIAVIVLYRLRPDESAAFKSLQASMSHGDGRGMEVKVLLYDNTPDPCDPGAMPDGVIYEAAQQNAGLAAAYNRALEIAEAESFNWLLSLDQDTALPEQFLSKINAIAAGFPSNSPVAAIVPKIADQGRILSPSWWLWGSIPIMFSSDFTGISTRSTSAFNSASTIRVSALQIIGGYDCRFWLDYLDAYLFRQLFKHGMQVYIANDIQVDHQFSVLDMNQRVSISRYQNILDAGCAFWDLELGWLAGLDYTARLIYRTFYKHWRYGHNPAFRRASLKMLKKRLFWSKKHRIEEWERKTERRLRPLSVGQKVRGTDSRPQISVCMAAYNGERFIAAQLQSILSQLVDSDEVIVVDDASRDGTVAIIESFHDRRVRIIRNFHNRGVVRSFERAIGEARGDVIFLSDQDDLWNPEKVRRVLHAFKHPSVTLVQSDANVIDANGNIISQSYCKIRGGFVPGVMQNIARCHYLGCAMAFRRQILTRCLPFPHNIPMHDIWIGIVNAHFGKTAYIAEPLVQYRRHGENFSRRGSLFRRIWWRVTLMVNMAKVVLSSI